MGRGQERDGQPPAAPRARGRGPAPGVRLAASAVLRRQRLMTATMMARALGTTLSAVARWEARSGGCSRLLDYERVLQRFERAGLDPLPGRVV